MAFQTNIDVSRLLRDNKYLKSIDENALVKLIETYPQSYTFKAILLKRYKLENNAKFDDYLQEVSFYAPNRKALYFFLKDDILDDDEQIEELPNEVHTNLVTDRLKDNVEEEILLEESELQMLTAELSEKNVVLESHSSALNG